MEEYKEKIIQLTNSAACVTATANWRTIITTPKVFKSLGYSVSSEREDPLDRAITVVTNCMFSSLDTSKWHHIYGDLLIFLILPLWR